MKLKLMLSLLLCVIAMPVFSAQYPSTIIKIDGHVTASQKELATGALLYLNDIWATEGKILSRRLTEKYFDPNIKLIINDKEASSGYQQLENHFKEISQHIKGKINFPLLEVIGVKNKLVVRFNENIEDKDNKNINYPATVVAIFTLHKGRIQNWEQIIFTNYFCRAESAKIVYSK